MLDLQTLFRAVDDLPPKELERLFDYIEQRRRSTWWIVPPDQLAQIDEVMRPVQQDAEAMSDEEASAVIDEAISEVRRERRQAQNRD